MMSVAKTNFLNRLTIFKLTLSSSILMDNGVATSTHNEKARILRNGISIIGFTILEDFIKERTGEVLHEIGSSPVSFTGLSSDMQQAITIGALRSIHERATNLKRSNEDWLSFIRNETSHIASTSGFPFSISKFSLGWEKSNLGKEDIPKFLKIFNVGGGFTSIQQVTSNANSTLIAPENFFLNAANRRHKAAHNPNANSLYTDLIDFSRDVKSFAFAYDALLSKGLNHIATSNASQVTHSNILIRFLIKDKGRWKEYSSTSGKAIRTDTNYNRLLAQAKRRAGKKQSILIIKNSTGEINNWFL